MPFTLAFETSSQNSGYNSYKTTESAYQPNESFWKLCAAWSIHLNINLALFFRY